MNTSILEYVIILFTDVHLKLTLWSGESCVKAETLIDDRSLIYEKLMKKSACLLLGQYVEIGSKSHLHCSKFLVMADTPRNYG